MLVPGRGHGQGSLERAETAVAYHHRFGASKIVFTGGNRGKSEATFMFNHVQEQVRGCTVILEHNAINSFTNILNCMSHLDPYLPLGIVAHGDNMAKMMLLAKKMLPNEHVFAVVAPKRCSLASWTTQALICEFTRVAYVGASKSDLENMRKRDSALRWARAKLSLPYNP